MASKPKEPPKPAAPSLWPKGIGPEPEGWLTNPDWVPPMFRTIKMRDGGAGQVHIGHKVQGALRVAHMRAMLEAHFTSPPPAREPNPNPPSPADVARLREFDNSEETARLRRAYDICNRLATSRSARRGDQLWKARERAEAALLAHVDASLGLQTSKLTGEAREKALRDFGAYLDEDSFRD